MGAQGHTPGPWFAIWNGHFWDINVGNYLHAQSVASNHANAVLKMSAEEAEANAHLIAAAPTIFEALKPFGEIDGEGDEDFPDDTKVTVTFGRTTDYTLTLGDFRRARAAIQSATGEAA